MNPVRRGYRALEAWFNLSFGPAWNPLYNLGTLTFFFFWVVLVSGLYLFVFFDTSIDGAYASVERLTREQWYLGGVMRSLHRYASDAAVICILLHMLREFALDRYRGFRWFSWFTGVPALWFVITLGITGYWLVWDELGLYVALLSSRLMDALPIVSGAMTRDFLEGQLTDRFFTLMGFLHLLGQPVILVFAIWIHVKRLSHVEISAPRGLALGSFAALLALSIAMPAQSHAPADLARVPPVLNIDWFYLNVYPLLDNASAGQTWMLTLGVTFLLMVAPWLPPKKTGPAAEVHLEQCNGCGQCADDCPFDAITVQARTDGARWSHEVVVQPSLCASCGICVGSCPSSNPFRQRNQRLVTGIDMPNYSANEMRERTDRALKALDGADSRIVVFGCDNAYDVSRLESDGAAAVRVFCVGMLPATLVEYALKKGASGVFVTGCRTGDCYFRYGNVWFDRRFEGNRKPRLRAGADRRRILVCRGAETDGAVIARALSDFGRAMTSLDREPDDTAMAAADAGANRGRG
ncbi:MAG: hydrogenase iron-sulfur subunit [Proteobacteria bacterium]|nr:MAG: hydrogenase iron-sulfur subunit [Pseudomonadota bacterium]